MTGAEPNGERSHHRLMAWYAALNGVVRAGTDARSPEQYAAEVTRILVECGEFAMSHIAMLDAATNQLVVIAKSGDSAGYTDRIRIFADERPEGRGPGGTAFREGTPRICNDFLNDPRTVLWHAHARAAGWLASAAIPIRFEEKPVGLLSVYARETDFFTDEEVELLTRAADGIGYVFRRFEQEASERSATSALAANRMRLRLAIDAAGIGSFDWDLTTGRVVSDGHLERLFGFAPGAFAGDAASLEARAHPDDAPRIQEALRRGLENRKTVALEYRIVRPDGSIHWLASRGEFFADEFGRPYMRGVVMDVDERKRHEEAARAANERLRQALDGMIEGCMAIDFEWRYVYVNEAAARHGFRQREELLGRRMQDIYPGIEGTNIFERYRRCMEDREPQQFQEHFSFSPGVTRWYELRVNPVPEGIFVLSLDITESREAQRMRDILASVVETSRDFIGVATLEGEVTYLNHAARKLTGAWDRDERALKITDFFAPEEAERFRGEVLPSILKDGWAQSEMTIRHFQTGDPIPVDMQGITVRNADGEPIGLATVTRDLREHKEAEKRRTELELQLDALGRLTAGIAHDFNNSLAVILGYASLLTSETGLSEEDRKAVAAIEVAGMRSRDLVRQLMGFSRQQLIAPKPLDLNAAIRDSRGMMRRLIGEDIEVEVIPEDGLWSVLMDASQVDQVLMNLMLNAQDAMPGGGKITVETQNVRVDEQYAGLNPQSRKGDYVLLAVSDTGTGMDAEMTARIFEPFFTTKPHGKGTGLGLATVYGIVRQNQGFVNVYSEPGHGTAFKLYFPRFAGAAETAREERPAQKVRAAANRGRVLVVEDDELVSGLTAEMVRMLGYEPIVALTSADAIKICAGGTALDMVVSDVVLPEMKGTELKTRIARTRPDLPFLFVSGYTSNVIARRGVLKPGMHFLQKPFSMEALGEKIREVLAERGAG
ncbi:MAG: PAS domain-containing protein [Acidobacteriota bacterium]|nr:PAS domain-containing protein [Acidobacteriota bacterium]